MCFIQHLLHVDPESCRCVSKKPSGKSETLCNILLLYVKHSHVRWMWIWAFWALGVFELRRQLFWDKASSNKKLIQNNQYAISMHVCLNIFFCLTPEPDIVAYTETTCTVVHLTPISSCQYGLKTSINIGRVDNGFFFLWNEMWKNNVNNNQWKKIHVLYTVCQVWI